MVQSGYGILHPGYQSQPLCSSRNLQLSCECTLPNQILTLPTFRLDNVNSNIEGIAIRNCFNVSIGSNSIKDLLSLRTFEVSNVENLNLEESSLFWPGYQNNRHEYDTTPSIKISVSSTKIVNIPQYAFKGKIGELRFVNVVFDKIQSLAFSGLSKVMTIEFKYSTVKQIFHQAFKKIETERLLVTSSRFDTSIPSRAFSDIDVTEDFRIYNSTFVDINPTGFIINQVKRTDISSSTFQNLQSESFLIRTRGPISIKNNLFNHLNDKSFSGLSYVKEHRAQVNQELLFDQNVINSFNVNNGLSFNRTSFTPKYGTIILNKTCSCVEIQIIVTNNEIKEYIYCVIDQKTFTTQRAMDFKTGTCDSGTKTWIILVAVFSVLLVVLIIVAIVVVILYRKYKRRKQKEYVNRGRTKTGSVGLIVPDGRTYRETEVHVILEKAELLTTDL